MNCFTTDDLLEILRLTYQEKKSQRKIAEVFGCGKSSIGDFLRKETYCEFWEAHQDKPLVGGTILSPDETRRKFTGKKFVFTAAQNNTYVHTGFLAALENYCDVNGAELVVGTFHYNKNAYQKGDEQDDKCWFDPKVRDYIIDESVEVAEDLLWCGELDIIPTAVNPLSGFHSYTKSESGIIPHAKVQLESLPTPKYDPCKMLYTTGAVTQRNYIERKAGQIASFHHVFGALVVEIDSDGDWFVRQLIGESKTGNFYDLDKYYTSSSVTESNVEAINWGDIHAAKLDDVVAEVCWVGSDSVLDTLKPKYCFAHDTLDMKFRNHHNIKDPYFRFKMHIDGTESVDEEIQLTASIIESMNREWTKLILVESNHDAALAKWLREQDYKTDPVNSEFFLEMQLETYRALRKGQDFGVFEYACKTRNENIQDVLFLGEDESFTVCGDIECGSHGHVGNNGARGSTRAFQAQGKRFNIGHQHSANIKDGVYVAGVSGKLDMGYNTGGSSWSHSNIITYKNGKRTIATIKNGKWRG